MKTRYGQSPWIAAYPAARRPDHPRFRGTHSAEVVIIGAGMTGCATAYACAVAGLKPVILEAGRVGQGASGRSAGLLLPEPGPSFREVAAAHGPRTAQKIFEAWRRASLDAGALVRRLSIPCALEPRDSLTVASADDEKALQREHSVREAAGIDGVWLTPKQVKGAAGLDSAGAIRRHGGFALDPYRACLGMASAAVTRGASIFERTRVTKVRFSHKNVEVLVDGGVVRASTAIVTTGTATEEFHALRRHFKRRERYLALSAPMPAAMRRQVGNRSLLLSRARGHLLYATRDHRLLAAGGDQHETPAKRREDVLIQRTGDLMYKALTMYPGISGLPPEYGWEVSYGETADRLMYVGAHRNYPRHFFALGRAGDSLTGAFLAARIAARAVRGAAEKGDDLFGWTR